MAFPTGTIRLEAAQRIFAGCDIQPITIAGEVAGYSAEYRGKPMQDKALTNLCSKLWAEATEG